MFPVKDNIRTEHFPLVTVALILANVVVYFAFQDGGILHGPSAASVVRYGLIPYEISHWATHCALQAGHVLCPGPPGAAGARPAPPATMFASMFEHAGILHLAGNMLFLWIFGNNVEDAMGRVRFVAFYLLGGLAAIALQVAIHPDSTVPAIGASGAIAAVLGGYILLYPRARVVTLVFIVFLFTILELPALVMLGLWFVEQALFGLYDLSDPLGGGGVAYYAHIGGFIFGLLAIRAFARRRWPAGAEVRAA
jgi:membrane associated rhomboid family serine protease